MGRKNSANISEMNQQEQEEVPIQQKVENSIKGLQTLQEKVHAIAINSYMIQKRELDKKLSSQINKIEVNDRKIYEPYLNEINDIISGNVDLTDADFEGIEDLLTQQEKQLKANYYQKKQLEEYWLKALLSSEQAGQTIQADDQNVLKHLMNITASKTEDGTNLTVIFHFSQNQWFNNATIKKQFQIDGQTINRSYGDAVQWKQGKNLTVQIVKKKNKKKKTTTTKEVKKKSFFNLFNEIDLTSDNQDDKEQEIEDDAEVEQLESQYQICNAIYERILPRSLQHYLGLISSFGDMGDLQGAGLQQIQEQQQEQQKPKKSKNKKRKASQSSKQ